MIRHTVRALSAATLVIAPLALTATPAHAAVSCRVNGFPVTGTTVVGTPGNDYITCGSLAADDLVRGEGGDDYIVVTGTVAGSVLGNTGRDVLRVYGTVTADGLVHGGDQNDYLRVDTNGGTVDGGTGLDVCRVGSGVPPTGCEA